MTILAAMIKNYRDEWKHELSDIAGGSKDTTGRSEMASSSYVGPTPDEMQPTWNPDLSDDLGSTLIPPSPWDFGELFGVVEAYSTMHLVDTWPEEKDGVGSAMYLYRRLFQEWAQHSYDMRRKRGANEPPPEFLTPNLYQQFLIVHLVRTMTRWKQLYKQLGLASLAATIIHLKLLAGTSPATVS